MVKEVKKTNKIAIGLLLTASIVLASLAIITLINIIQNHPFDLCEYCSKYGSMATDESRAYYDYQIFLHDYGVLVALFYLISAITLVYVAKRVGQ